MTLRTERGSVSPQALAGRLRTVTGDLLLAREAILMEIRPFLRKADLTEQQGRVLRVLIENGATSVSRLVPAALLHQASVTRILQDLHSRKFIARRADPHDKRQSIITITAKGRAVMERITPQMMDIVAGYRRRFGSERFDRLFEELNAFITEIAGT